MKEILPIPFINYVPKLLRQNIDTEGQAFIDKIDSLLLEIKNEILEEYFIKLPERCYVLLLDELGYYLNAGIKATDCERTKRLKIATAVQTHKKRGSWKFDAKIKIDIIAGGDSQIFTDVNSGAWVVRAGKGSEPDNYWSSLGADGVDANLGILLLGSGKESDIPGNVYIDVDNNSLTADEIDQLVNELEDIVPAYFFVHLGYLDGLGQFVEYTVMG